ncbi:MBOAT family protein [Fulvivirga sp. M361]|uniref:MBOAT family O-acyltransferase n=1 Tax=Fulvivirga sp. M361 TaxID=2594266 RepID=UPI00117B0288|nr:MBOAT family O-acyltransferase [Fulvivirga sp. M361]TRX50230.1 MBOAT family protein [Fulvivirga sp. M361]
MLFNSLEYFFFLPVVVLLYYLIPFRYRWGLLLIASYVFYSYWKVEYLVLILFSTAVDYYAGYKIGTESQPQQRKVYLYLSLFVNLGLLFLFKYYNFFAAEFLKFSGNSEYSKDFIHQLILPVGISFYTFQTMSYTIDIYKGKQKHERHLGIFALYVVFFPQLVAGPIERAGHLLKQFRLKTKITFSNFHFGFLRILWGLFKKVVIADRLSFIVNEVFNNIEQYNGLHYLIATVLFAFQIYCDFSGYSDIAIGSARLLGIRLMENFKRPYLAASISEFWHRWHISLSTWFRDYLYIPLGGSRVVKWRWYYNLFITFLISGLWHGANWTFIIWGALHGAFLMVENIIPRRTREFYNSFTPKFVQVSIVFFLVLLSWVFFRSNNIHDVFYMSSNFLADNWNMSVNVRGQILYIGQPLWRFTGSISLIGILIVVDLLIERGLISEPDFVRFNLVKRWLVYLSLIFSILFLGVFELNEFIYFQF